ncbi:hypothetical protein GGI35DRAFT_80015 [Trichoderma velutinum]
MKATLILGTIVSRLTLVKSECLPQVDLGYEIHEALKYNDTTGLYTFSNIRYAQPPVGDLRFSAPQPPTGRNQVVQKGNGSLIMCPQGSPGWSIANSDFGHAFINGNLSSYNYTAEHAAQELLRKKMPRLSWSSLSRQKIAFSSTLSFLVLCLSAGTRRLRKPPY